MFHPNPVYTTEGATIATDPSKYWTWFSTEWTFTKAVLEFDVKKI